MAKWFSNNRSASRNCRRARASLAPTSPTKRSSFPQTTRVPCLKSRRSSIPGTPSSNGTLSSCQSPADTRWSRSHRLMLTPVLSEQCVATVRDRAWEIEAVLRPRPYLPRSDGSRSSVGLWEPILMASTKPNSDIPQPSSRIETQEPAPAQWKCSQMFLAPAEMLLSIRSDTASGREYPVALRDSMRVSARGATRSKEPDNITCLGYLVESAMLGLDTRQTSTYSRFSGIFYHHPRLPACSQEGTQEQ